MDINTKKLVVFDLNGTLSENNQPVNSDITNLLTKLLTKVKVAIVSGYGFAEFQKILLPQFPSSINGLSNLILLPASSTVQYVWRGNWDENYRLSLAPREKKEIISTINDVLRATNSQIQGQQQIVDRDSQITFSVLGTNAQIDTKKSWDLDKEKRRKLVQLIQNKIPGYDVRISGQASIDITKRGVNKSYGIRKLEDALNITSDEILFIGDSIFQGGNDYPIKATGVDCVTVQGPNEVQKLLLEWAV